MRREDKMLVIEDLAIYRFYRSRLIQLALSQFEYQNLPDTCDARYFEQKLLCEGKACFYKPTIAPDTIISSGYIIKGGFDGYGRPAKIAGVDFHGHQFATDDFVMLWDNPEKTILLPWIELYAKKLYEIDQVIRSNLRQQITPYIIESNKNTALSLKNFFQRIFSFQPVLQVKSLQSTTENMRTLDLRVDFIGRELNDLKENIWAEALHILGIAPSKTKKERMITNEVMMDRQEDILSLQARLLQRTRFINEVNKKWGLDISVNLSILDENVSALTSPDYSGTFGYNEGKETIAGGYETTRTHNYIYPKAGKYRKSLDQEAREKDNE